MIWAIRESSPTPAGSIPRCIGASLWTMRQFAGFGSAADTNRRFKYLLQHGQTGLSVAFDMPTLMGIDADDARAHGEIGHCGVAISSLSDMERLFEDIPLDQVTTSMTINGPAVVHLRDVSWLLRRNAASPWSDVGGTLQNDILKEYIAQKEWLFPPDTLAGTHHRHHRLLCEAGSQVAPGQHQRYHIREADRPRCRNWPSPCMTGSPTLRQP